MSLNSNLERLIGLLTQETELYRSMQAVIDREKDAVIRSDLNALQETAIEKAEILNDLQNTEEKRRQLVADLADDLGCDAPGLTLTGISEQVDEPYAGNLRQVSEAFSSVLGQVQADNQRNKQIFEHSLEILRGSLNLLNEGLTPNTVYYRTGDIQSSKKTGKCVSSEV